MNNNIRMRRLAGYDVPSFYGYIKEAKINVKDEISLTEATWNAINPDDKGLINGVKHYLTFTEGLLGVVPVKMIKVGGTEAEAPTKVEPFETKIDDTTKSGGDPEKTADAVIKDVKSGKRKTTTDGVVKEDLEDLNDESDEEEKDDPEVECKECGKVFVKPKVREVASCEDHEGLSPVGGESDEEEEVAEAVKHTKNHTIHDDHLEWKAHNDMSAADHQTDPEYSDEEDEGHKVTHAHIKKGKNKLLVGTWDHSKNKGITFHADEKLKESAEAAALKLIASVRSGKRITDTKDVPVDDNAPVEKLMTTLGKTLVKDVEIANTEDRDLKDVKAPTDMKSSEKSKTDGDPKSTELKSDTNAPIANGEVADTEDRDLKDVKAPTDMKSSEKSKTDGEPKSTALKVKEAWEEKMDTPKSKKGMFDGKSKEELDSELAKLKKSGPHKEGSPEFTKVKELEFALRAKNKFGKVEESAEEIAKRIIAQVKAGNHPHDAENDGNAKEDKNNGFDYNKLLSKTDQVDATRKSPEEEKDTQAEKTGKPEMKAEKVSVPKKVVSQIDQRIKELEEAKKDFDSVNYNGTNGKDNAIEFLQKVKEHLNKGNVEGFQDAQVLLTTLSSPITSYLPAALLNFLNTGRNSVTSDGQKPE